MGYPIVVGVDGSEESRLALDWAADEAVRLGLPLRIVHSWRWLPHGDPTVPAPIVTEDKGQRALAEELLDEAAARARGLAPELDVTTYLDQRAVGPLLVEESRKATTVVVGSRGHGGFAGLLLGSVSLVVAAQAESPVVVVRPAARRGDAAAEGGEVLLGVDGRKPNPAATAFAFEQADRRGLRLRALHAWTQPLPDQEARLLAEALAGWAEQYPQVQVVEQVSPDPAGKALVTASHQADLLVVGARRRQSVVGMALGAANHTVLHHARCPVAVVPEQG
jgi:nucleotide-binding universal stress UspA family protein